MSLLGFKERFVPLVEARVKKHSIRAKIGHHQVGRNIQLYRRVRQKDMRKIVDVDPVCTKIEPILIRHWEGKRWEGVGVSRAVTRDGILLSMEEVATLAIADGFGDSGAFFEFFVPNLDDAFAGYLIHWDWVSP